MRHLVNLGLRAVLISKSHGGKIFAYWETLATHERAARYAGFHYVFEAKKRSPSSTGKERVAVVNTKRVTAEVRVIKPDKRVS